MKLSFVTVRPSGSHTSVAGELINTYLQRCRRDFVAEQRPFRTEAALLAALQEQRRQGAAAFWIADPGGTLLTTEQFTDRIRLARDTGPRHILLAVGPADGWSAGARAAADLRISLGAMTLPHELAALVLAEQVYRASTILQGHPYHLGH